MCCAGVMNSQHGLWRNREATLHPSHYLSINKGREGQVVVGGDDLPVHQCDLTATNGVVHTIDRVLSDALPRRRHSKGGRQWIQDIRQLLEKRFGHFELGPNWDILDWD